ncbi:hypothetical protein SAMN05216277_10832 [Halolamina pelagica]|uniref:Uncharacterized protein n=1 Tax=Halolamina pelagica TaxID=699431 RepID=A0A1I5T6X1_9EURY|nr:hypothetical protein SAMN05216277_10832 [Halolamina pelagica]
MEEWLIRYQTDELQILLRIIDVQLAKFLTNVLGIGDSYVFKYNLPSIGSCWPGIAEHAILIIRPNSFSK